MSPFAGNARDLCLNDAGERYANWRVVRGGYGSAAGLSLRSATRGGFPVGYVSYAVGARLLWLPRLGSDPADAGDR